jgi:hypothetical protein
MTERPLAAVARVAATPAQAKIFVAQLQAEGIPAYVEGESLADEFAMSRQLMNLGGTKVMVPTSSLERARELLDVDGIDAEELAAQAMAAESGEREVPPTAPAVAPERGGLRWAPVATLLAVLFAALWLNERSKSIELDNRVHRYEPTADGFLTKLRKDGRAIAQAFDTDFDGYFERVVTLGRGGQAESIDDDRDGIYDRFIERRMGIEYAWRDLDGDGLFDHCRVTDEAGKLLQEVRYEAGRGFDLSSK